MIHLCQRCAGLGVGNDHVALCGTAISPTSFTSLVAEIDCAHCLVLIDKLYEEGKLVTRELVTHTGTRIVQWRARSPNDGVVVPEVDLQRAAG